MTLRMSQEVLNFECRSARVVAFGGGTGLSTVVGGNPQLDDWPEHPFVGLKEEFSSIDVVVCTTDDGGSTGLLLQQFPLIGIGDLRKVLLSLILRGNLRSTYGLDDSETMQLARVIHCIFNHRFPPDVLEGKRFHPGDLRRTMLDIIWENRDIRIDHLNLFGGVEMVSAELWNRSKEWDNVLGYYEPEKGMLRVHEQLRDDSERIRDNLLIALGESLLGRYLQSRRWTDSNKAGDWGARCYEITLRPVEERGCFLEDAELHTYLTLSRMVRSPHDPRTYRIALNDQEGFLPPSLLFGLLYAWYLNNTYGAIMEYEMSLLRWPPQTLIPHQIEERKRKQALIAFFRSVVFKHVR
jgi:hypothetical protein